MAIPKAHVLNGHANTFKTYRNRAKLTVHRTNHDHHHQHQEEHLLPPLVLALLEGHPEGVHQVPHVEEIPDEGAAAFGERRQVLLLRLLDVPATVEEGEDVHHGGNREDPVETDLLVEHPAEGQPDREAEGTEDVYDSYPEGAHFDGGDVAYVAEDTHEHGEPATRESGEQAFDEACHLHRELVEEVGADHQADYGEELSDDGEEDAGLPLSPPRAVGGRFYLLGTTQTLLVMIIFNDFETVTI